MQHPTEHDTDAKRLLLIAEFADTAPAEQALSDLNAREFPLDQVSILGGGQSSGDDPLGVYHQGIGERMEGWGKMGALWGGLLGLSTGAAGMFIVPGLGAVLAAGPIVQAFASAAAGAAIGGGAIAGAAAVTQLSVAMHRMGIPEAELARLEQAVRDGRTLLLIHVDTEAAERWQALLEGHDPATVHAFPEP